MINLFYKSTSPTDGKRTVEYKRIWFLGLGVINICSAIEADRFENTPLKKNNFKHTKFILKDTVLIDYQNINKITPIIQLYLFNTSFNFLIKINLLKDVLRMFKTHFKYQFKILTCISGSDYPENYYRFNVLYELLTIKYNSRLRVKIIVDEITPLNSIEKVFIGADWWENEVWDMFGIFFLNKANITRLLTDYGFQGYPLRKDFPLTGFTESRYSVTKNRVVYENVELAQEYRTFDYMSPWEELYKT